MSALSTLSEEQIGEIIFWLLAAVLGMAFLRVFLDVRIPARVLVPVATIVAAVGALVWAANTFPPEVIGGWLTWGSLAGMWFGLFWALTRGR